MNSRRGQPAALRFVRTRLTLSNTRQPRKVLVQVLLPLVEFAAPSVVHAEAGHDAVDNQEPVLVRGEELGQLLEKFGLVLAVLRSRIRYVVERLIRVDTEALGDLLDSLWSKRAFSIDVCYLAFGAAHVLGLSDSGSDTNVLSGYLGQLGVASVDSTCIACEETDLSNDGHRV